MSAEELAAKVRSLFGQVPVVASTEPQPVLAAQPSRIIKETEGYEAFQVSELERMYEAVCATRQKRLLKALLVRLG